MITVPSVGTADVFQQRLMPAFDGLVAALGGSAGTARQRDLIVNGVPIRADLTYTARPYDESLLRIARARADNYLARFRDMPSPSQLDILLRQPRYMSGAGWAALVDLHLYAIGAGASGPADAPRVSLAMQHQGPTKSVIWELQFRSVSDLLRLVRPPEPGPGSSHPLADSGFPGSAVAFSLSEYAADHEWHLITFAGKGNPLEHAKHYSAQLQSQGFVEDRTDRPSVSSRYIQLSVAGAEAAISSSLVPGGTVYDVVQINLTN